VTERFGYFVVVLSPFDVAAVCRINWHIPELFMRALALLFYARKTAADVEIQICSHDIVRHNRMAAICTNREDVGRVTLLAHSSQLSSRLDNYSM